MTVTCHFVDSCFVAITPSSGSFTGLFEYSLSETFEAILEVLIESTVNNWIQCAVCI
jgi:hypothetical protein